MTCEDMIYSNDYEDFIINYLGGYEGGMEYYQDGCVNPIIENIAIFHRPRRGYFLTNLESTPYSFIPKLYGLMDTTNLDATGVSVLQRENGLNLDGKNVLVGVIDTGLDYQNELFYNLVNDKKISRVVAIWDQTEKGLEKGELVSYGTVYEQEEITRALNASDALQIVPSIDENGHGTFLTGVAAGKESLENNFCGVAPDADIAVVKLKEAKPYLKEYFGVESDAVAYQETDIICGVQFLKKLARQRNQPVSILIGVGTSNGGHYGTTFLERYVDATFEDVGIMVSVPAGNEGNERLHYSGSFEPEQDYQQVELNVAENQEAIVLEFWGKSPTTYGLGLISPQGDQIEKIPPRFGQEEEFMLPLTGSKVYVAYQFVEIYTGNELIFVRITKPTPGIWRLLVYANEGSRRDYDIWLPLRQFQKEDTYFLISNPENTVVNPGNGVLPMTIGAINHLNGSLYAAGSRGFNSLNQVVPTLVAPGVNILGPGLRNNFVTRTGTSVSAAHSAGMMALFLQWNEKYEDTVGYFYPTQIKNLFIRNAIRRENMVYPNSISGYGFMNIENVFDDFRVVGS